MPQIAILLFDRITALDAIGPYEVLARLPGADLRFVATKKGEYRTDNKTLGVMADFTLGETPNPEILVVPGGWGSRKACEDAAILEWVRSVHAQSQWTTSVCTGSLILAAAGILNGLRATTHWLAMDRLAELGAIPTSERVIRQGKVVTAAGVSSGIDMALMLAALIAGDDAAQSIQLGIEYDPEPPFNAGSPAKAPTHIVEQLRAVGRKRAGAGDL